MNELPDGSPESNLEWDQVGKQWGTWPNSRYLANPSGVFGSFTKPVLSPWALALQPLPLLSCISLSPVQS